MALIHLNQVNGNSCYATGPLSIGVYLDDQTKSAILIDTGLDQDTAKKIDQTVTAQGYSIQAVLNTHSHADHIGGNHYLQKKYPQIRIYATAFEAPFIENPYLEPYCFSTAAVPFQELRNKFMEAKPSRVDQIIPYEDGALNVLGVEFQVVALPGHSPGMIGLITPDGVMYCADALFGESTIEKHGLLYYTDVQRSIESLNKLKGVRASHYVLYHGGVYEEISPLVERHVELFGQTEDFIMSAIREGSHSFEAVMKRVMEKYKAADKLAAYTLNATVVRAYLAYLQQQNRLEVQVVEGVLSFVPVDHE